MSAYILVILIIMKTAISIPDSIFELADQFAGRQGLSRSELYTRAIKDYLKNHRQDKVTEALNDTYSQQPSKIDPNIERTQLNSLAKESW